jgi:hypothetical protein
MLKIGDIWMNKTEAGHLSISKNVYQLGVIKNQRLAETFC